MPKFYVEYHSILHYEVEAESAVRALELMTHEDQRAPYTVKSEWQVYDEAGNQPLRHK